MATRTWTGATDGDLGTATNWSGDTLPIAADDIVFDGLTTQAITAGFADLTAINLGSITFDGCSYSIGDSDNYVELQSDEVYIKSATGAVYVDFKTTAPTIEAESCTNFNFTGAIASTDLNMSGGTINAGVPYSDNVTIATINLFGGTLNIGSGATLTTLNIAGGTCNSDTGFTTVNSSGGTCNIGGTSATTTINGDGAGSVNYNSTGNLTTLNIDNGVSVDFTKTAAERTVTTINLNGVGSVKYNDRTTTVTDMDEGTFNKAVTIAVN